MSISLSTPVTGGPQTGFTSPTYTVVADTAPGTNGKQWAVSALGGTQTGVRVHSASDPFTVTFERPVTVRQAPIPNPVTGVIGNVPRNTYKVRVRKGVLPAVGQNPQVMLITGVHDVPAGADIADPANVRAGSSLFNGSLWQQSAGWGDTLNSAVI
nr:MAG: coat protein [Leviviridae sp.]